MAMFTLFIWKNPTVRAIIIKTIDQPQIPLVDMDIVRPFMTDALIPAKQPVVKVSIISG